VVGTELEHGTFSRNLDVTTDSDGFMFKRVVLMETFLEEGTSRGRAIAQAVSRWLPTAAARVQTRSSHVGFVVDKVGLGQVFSEYFGFPCQSSFH
jgi:hypothetical protein